MLLLPPSPPISPLLLLLLLLLRAWEFAGNQLPECVWFLCHWEEGYIQAAGKNERGNNGNQLPECVWFLRHWEEGYIQAAGKNERGNNGKGVCKRVTEEWSKEWNESYTTVYRARALSSVSSYALCTLLHRWFIYKHSRPLPEEIVRFPPYNEREDLARGTTVQPYLEAFYNYDSGNSEEQQQTPAQPQVATATVWGTDMGLPPAEPLSVLSPLPPPRSLRQQGSWLSEDPCYLIDRDVLSRISNNSSEKAEQSTENISLKKSRVSSRENGEMLQ